MLSTEVKLLMRRLYSIPTDNEDHAGAIIEVCDLLQNLAHLLVKLTAEEPSDDGR
jgi:hypothetical protein